MMMRTRVQLAVCVVSCMILLGVFGARIAVPQSGTTIPDAAAPATTPVVQTTSPAVPATATDSPAPTTDDADDASVAIPDELVSCETGDVWESKCLDDYFTTRASNGDVSGAMQLLGALTATDPDVAGQCHGISHNVGELAAAEGLDAAMSEGADICQFGYYHGLFVGWAQDVTSDEFLDAAPTLCDYFDGKDFSLQSCIHGIGHAAVQLTGDDAKAGVELCSSLPDVQAQTNCGTGVVMEWSSSQAPALLEAQRGDDVENVCVAMADPYRASCLREASTAWLTLWPGDFEKVTAACDAQAVDDTELGTCYEGVGFRAIIWAQFDPVQAAELCGTGTGDMVGRCSGGAAVVDFEQNRFATSDAGDRVCAAAQMTQRAGCLAVLAETKTGYETLADEQDDGGTVTESADTTPTSQPS